MANVRSNLRKICLKRALTDLVMSDNLVTTISLNSFWQTQKNMKKLTDLPMTKVDHLLTANWLNKMRIQ